MPTGRATKRPEPVPEADSGWWLDSDATEDEYETDDDLGEPSEDDMSEDD